MEEEKKRSISRKRRRARKKQDESSVTDVRYFSSFFFFSRDEWKSRDEEFSWNSVVQPCVWAATRSCHNAPAVSHREV